MLTYQQALEQIIAAVTPLEAQELPLQEAHGQILAAPALSRWEMPRWDNSAMDGFAIAAESLSAPGQIRVVGQAFAGHPFNPKLQPGEAIQITTGAPLPKGSDTVIPVEDADLREERLLLHKEVKAGQHVRYRGEEYRVNEELLPPGACLTAGGIGLLAGAGITTVTVLPRPTVAIFSTGDELVELGREPGPGQIVNSNLQYLIARIRECGCIPMPLGIGEDNEADLDRLLDQAESADLLLTTGGVSVGEKDLVQQTLQKRGFQRQFWKVAIKPGKPVLFGTLDSKPCFGLPGNPAATAATFELFVRPTLQRLAGQPEEQPISRIACLQNEVKSGGKRQAFLWCHCVWAGDGYQVSVPDRQGSGQMRSIAGANALLPMPIGGPDQNQGEKVELLMLRTPPAN